MIHIIYFIQIKSLTWYFLWTKVLECSDTIVISMRGGLYPTWVFVHHCNIILVGWIGLAFVPSGTSNCHILCRNTRICFNLIKLYQLFFSASIFIFINSLGHFSLYLFLTLKYVAPNAGIIPGYFLLDRINQVII